MIMSDYSKFLQRLNAYRQNLQLTQTQMAELFGMHQSHYGRCEAGTRVVPFQSLKTFEKRGGDLFLLLTGNERSEGPVETFLAACRDDTAKDRMIKLLIWCVEFGCWMDHRDEKDLVTTMRKGVWLVELEDHKTSLWERIRKVEGLTQLDMADLLGMEVKRYRRIEKREIDADVEVLCALYDRLHYSPQMFFDVDRFYVDELNYYWNLLLEDTKGFLRKIVEAAIEKMQGASGQ